MLLQSIILFFFFFNDPPTPEIYPLSLPAALPISGRFMLLWLLVIAVAALFFIRLPASFLPAEDQGYMIVNVQLPPGATANRTVGVMEQAEGFIRSEEHTSELQSPCNLVCRLLLEK